MQRTLLTLVCALFLTLPTRAQSSTVRRVVIESAWSGYAIPPNRATSVEITSQSDGTYAAEDGSLIEPLRIQVLVKALDEPAYSSPSMEDLGLTASWLKQEFGAVEKKNNEIESNADASERQRALLRGTFETPSRLKPVVDRLFHAGRHTDDNPFVRITVTLADGSTLQAASRSQYEFMLPWTFTIDGRQVAAYNSNVSRAVANLLPKDGVNRERLNGEGLAEALGGAAMDFIQDDWNLIGAEERAPQTLALIRSRYQVRTAEITGNYSALYGKAWRDGKSQQSNLIVEVRGAAYPRNFDQSAVFVLHGAAVVGANDFMDRVPRYESLALSVPWLAHLLQQYPAVHAQLQYVESASLGGRGLKVFLADMRAIHRNKLADEVGQERDQVSLLIVDEKKPVFTESYWVVLPDKRMILWRYSGPKSKLVPYTGLECSKDDPEAVGGCVGRTKLPSGEWESGPTDHSSK